LGAGATKATHAGNSSHSKPKSTPTSAVPIPTFKVTVGFKLNGLTAATIGDLKDAELFVAMFQRVGKEWSLIGQTDRVYVNGTSSFDASDIENNVI
jgi:hypothetical protein